MAEGFLYVVMCHHKREQALRLARTIRGLSPDSTVLLRHDRPAGYISRADAAAAGADLLVSSIHGGWGRWTLVSAALEAFAYARETHDPAWVVLISGQDYPVRPLGEWEEETRKAGHDGVVSGEPLVTGPLGRTFGERDDMLRMRYTHRWWWLPRPGLVPRLPPLLVRAVRAGWYRHLYDKQAVVVLNELPRGTGWALGIRRAHVPWSGETPAYKGDQWVALSRRALAASLDGPRAKEWQRYFARTLIPDEAYFPTVMADADLRVDPRGISWLRWNTDVSRPHPVLITPPLVEEAAASARPFARKFDEDAAPGILDLVDRRHLHRVAEAAP